MSASEPAPTDPARWGRLFWAWLAGRTAFWTLLAVVALPNAPLDLVEWLAWGHEWQWGYPKHPPLPAWVAEVFSRLSPGDVWGVYLAGYLLIALTLWAVWRLAREVLPPPLALAATACLDGLMFFTVDVAEFNNNVALDAFWAVAILCFHRAVRTDRLGWWIGLGAAVGLGMLSKYTMLLVLAPMVVWLAVARADRRVLARPGPYLAAGVAAGLFAPHVVWMARHDFITVRYGLESTADSGWWVNHLKNPVLFLLSQVGRLVPVAVILWPLIASVRRLAVHSDGRRRDRDFLAFMVLVPVAVLLAGSLMTGAQLREIWGSPLWAFAGVLLLTAVPTAVTARSLAHVRRNWAVVTAGFAAFVLAKPTVDPLLTGRPGRANYPGRALALAVEAEWKKVGSRPLPVVAGDCWIAGNVCVYVDGRASLYSTGVPGVPDLDPAVTPWTSDEDVAARGGALVWDTFASGDTLPPLFRDRFPTAGPIAIVTLPYQRARSKWPVRIGVVIVPPAGPWWR